eukprot:Nitzschia sp. Nitz4//scaffold198_size39746//28569//30416//NITZ4_007605-RA/size39746-processed-gene-0.37-mRNA-1//1//CDS//3329540530//7815//frame0
MSALPPYSTFRTDNKQMAFPQATSHGNILTFTPPGFKQSLNVKFPDSRLAVCERCKKNFKTRDMCRVRNTHTGPPWTTAYICLTLDDSCTDAEGRYIDRPFTVRMVQWQPYRVKTPFDPKTPVCSACKKTNRTKSFCRERHKHRQLPWCTVYVLLSALDSADPSTVVADPSKPVDENAKVPAKEDGESGNGDEAANSLGDETPGDDSKPANLNGDSTKEPGNESGENDSDDINDIADSRTFLVKVNCVGTTIHWLELVDFEGDQSATGHLDPAYMQQQLPLPDPNMPYYHPAYGPPQHQHAMKSQQHYYYHMQRQQQAAAQYAAWQAHYGHPQHHMPPPMPPQLGPQHMTPPDGGPDGENPDSPGVHGDHGGSHLKRPRDMGEVPGQAMSPMQHMGGPPPPGGQHHMQQPHWMMYQPMYPGKYPVRPGPPPEGAPMPPANDYPPPLPEGHEGHEDGSDDTELKRPRRE